MTNADKTDPAVAPADQPVPVPPWRAPATRRIAPVIGLPLGVSAGNMLAWAHRPGPGLVFGKVGKALVKVGRSAGLSGAERELVILRTAWTTRAYFPYAAHMPMARMIRRRGDERPAIQQGPDHPAWTEREAALLRFVDELQRDLVISAPTRAEAARHFSADQLVVIAGVSALYEATGALVAAIGFRVSGGMRQLAREQTLPTVGARPLVRRGNPVAPKPDGVASWAVADPAVVAAAEGHPRIGSALHDAIARWTQVSLLAGADTEAVVGRVQELANGRTLLPGNDSDRSSLLLRMTDQVWADRFVDDETWSAATEFFTDRELLDLCALVCAQRLQYCLARA